MVTVKDILAFIETIAPTHMKESWDNVGLNCGHTDAEVSTVLVALDPFGHVCEEAREVGAQLLLTHGAYTLFGIADNQTFLRGLLYAVVMCVLFVASFLIQQRWVFAAKQSQTKNEV